MALLSLPSELLLQVTSYLDQEGLLSLCLTCKAARSCAEVHLYKRIYIGFDCEETLEAYEDTSEFGPAGPLIHQYFYSLWNRPQLATHVKHVVLCINTEPRETDLLDIPPPPDLMSSWAGAIQDLVLPEAMKDRLLPLVKKGDAVALGTVLVSRFPNVESIDAPLPFARPPSLLGRVLRYATAPDAATHAPSTFSRLKELTIDNDVDRDGYSWPPDVCLEPILDEELAEPAAAFERRKSEHLSDITIPYLEDTMTLWHTTSLQDVSMVLEANGNRALSKLDILPIPRPNIKSLQLFDWGDNETLLARLFSSLPHVEHVNYFRGLAIWELEDDDDHELGHENYWANFFAFLQPTASSLKSLTISVDTADDPRTMYHTPWTNELFQRMSPSPLPPLTDFGNLRTLEVPLFVLLGWDGEATSHDDHSYLADILPSSLETLSVRHDLIDNYDYNWIPWDKIVHPARYRKNFANTAVFIYPLKALDEYIRVPGHSLKTVELKTTPERTWRKRSLDQLGKVCRRHGVELIQSVCDGWGGWRNRKFESTIIVPKPGDEVPDKPIIARSRQMTGQFHDLYGR